MWDRIRFGSSLPRSDFELEDEIADDSLRLVYRLPGIAPSRKSGMKDGQPNYLEEREEQQRQLTGWPSSHHRKIDCQ